MFEKIKKLFQRKKPEAPKKRAQMGEWAPFSPPPANTNRLAPGGGGSDSTGFVSGMAANNMLVVGGGDGTSKGHCHDSCRADSWNHGSSGSHDSGSSSYDSGSSCDSGGSSCGCD